jgi:sarcosine oxidase, subunit beta
MIKGADTVIIGGGVVGASIAYHLAKRGMTDVLIIERERQQGMGSTGKATGGVRAQFETDININMSLYSIDFFENWDHYSGYDPKGYLFFATTDDEFQYLRRNVEKQRSLGVRGVELLDQKSVKKILPLMNCNDITGGTFGSRDGFIDPFSVMEGFTTEAVGRGVRIEFGTKALAIDAEAGEVRGVLTDRGRIDCRNVVLCAGAWAKVLSATAGINLPIEPMRRQIVWARSEIPLPPDLPMVIDLGSGFHFRPAKDFGSAVTSTSPSSRGFSRFFKAKGRRDNDQRFDVMFAYPDRDEAPSFNTEFDETFIGKVYEKARYRAPFLYETTPVREKCRAGLYENTPDRHAILGACDVRGLYFANGFSGHGVMHSPATGRALSEIVLDGKSSFLDVSSLSIDRFAKDELLHETGFI